MVSPEFPDAAHPYPSRVRQASAWGLLRPSKGTAPGHSICVHRCVSVAEISWGF